MAIKIAYSRKKSCENHNKDLKVKLIMYIPKKSKNCAK